MTIVPTLLLILLFIAIAGLIIAKLKGKKIPFAVIILLSFFALCMAAIVAFVKNGEDYSAYQQQTWQSLSPEQIQPLVAQGYTVVVDIKADWCLPCRTNEANVWHREPIVDALSADNIVLMRGDLSQPNALVEQYLQSEQGYGTPFNMIYGPARPKGIKLPQQLEMTHVYDAINAVSR
ncbi:thioredoxin family protein [Shewanella intestini]|uniref:Thiol:disulfide interchange protein n=1 Tax=Shewanella intestini TaxID=2017544 RepID=A0ABS5HXA2_9GAMM|nr:MULTISPECIES: thioredoxin family protein [Shewanella]MBR9726392.1 thiol:disulfide interchange protein [Shewanella intestini]MRG35042.1 thiol:disulfide interchange protein [Shewanella sp. XMDDZSB0408]